MLKGQKWYFTWLVGYKKKKNGVEEVIAKSYPQIKKSGPISFR